MENRRKFKPINNDSVVEQIIKSITDSIIKGEYKPGMKIPNEYELIEEFQVGRNSLREAIKTLSAMGILEIRRGDGTYVCSKVTPGVFDTVVYSIIYDLKSNSDLLELRQVLDEATVRMAMQKITTSELKELYQSIDKMEQAIKKGSIKESQKYDLLFHMQLIDSCKNELFSRILKNVYAIFEKSIEGNVEKEKNDSKAPLYHRNILKCIENKDENSVSKVVKDSLCSWY